jgi:hypothetical protein
MEMTLPCECENTLPCELETTLPSECSNKLKFFFLKTNGVTVPCFIFFLNDKRLVISLIKEKANVQYNA